jgi:hypothetical protein
MFYVELIFIFIFIILLALFSMFMTTTFTPNAYFFSFWFSGDVLLDGIGMSWHNLPPSLKPPPEGGYQPLPFVDWG